MCLHRQLLMCAVTDDNRLTFSICKFSWGTFCKRLITFFIVCIMELAPEQIFVSLVFHFPLCFIVHINPEHCQLCETRVINLHSTAKYEGLFKLINISAGLQSAALLQWIFILLSRSNLQHKQLLRRFVGTAVQRLFHPYCSKVRKFQLQPGWHHVLLLM